MEVLDNKLSEVNMVDSIISKESILQSENNSINHGHIHKIRTTGQGLSKILGNNNQANISQKVHSLSPLSIVQLAQMKNTNNVKDLNLVLGNITHLKNDMINKIFNYLKSSQYKVHELTSEKHESSEEGIYESDEIVTEQRAVVEQLIVLMLIRLQAYLYESQTIQAYKLISVYQFESNNEIYLKHMLSIIPYISEMPMDGISEITSYGLNGQINKEIIASKLLNGGHSYTQNWLGLFVMNRSDQEFVQKISIPYGSDNLFGFAVNYNIDSSVVYQQTRFNLYVEDFVRYW